MSYYPELVEKLIEKIIKLPGIGPKSAERIVNYILEENQEDINALAENLISLKEKVKLCQRCLIFLKVSYVVSVLIPKEKICYAW